MNIGEKRKFYTGVALLKPIKFNPTREELNQILGIESDKEIEYVKEVELKYGDNEGIKTLKSQVVLWVKDVKNGHIFNISFDIYNTNNVSKAGNLQFVNQYGKTTWVDKEENLKKEFKFHKKGFDIEYKPCLKGLDNLYACLRALITDTYIYFGGSKDEDVILNTSKFFEEDFSQLNELLEKIPNNKFIAIAGVDEILDDERKTYQKWCNKSFLPGRMYPTYEVNTDNNFEYIYDFVEKKIVAQQGDKLSIGWFLKSVSDDNTWKSFRKYGLLEEYNENENPAINEGVSETPWYQ